MMSLGKFCGDRNKRLRSGKVHVFVATTGRFEETKPAYNTMVAIMWTALCAADVGHGGHHN
jgi:hypothetical protein